MEPTRSPCTPEPTADGFDTLYSATYGQTYHSVHGALTEARHVFLRGSGVEERLARGLPTCVLEVGFGTGLNFLVSARRASELHGSLRYVALEKEVLGSDILARLNHGKQLGVSPLRDILLAWRRSLPENVPPGRYQVPFTDTLSLDLIVGDATVVDLPDLGYDAVYLDAFSPDANPELWTVPFFTRLYAVMRRGSRLATYSAKGTVRRSLADAGFQVEKRPGPPGKRDMLVAIR
ncbi:MAG: tRNA (5-methylaminomethyl-2-thiouridine)(34)-methyltransferase MnmD [Rhodothermales bacterium]